MIRLLLFTAVFCGTVVLTADWTAVERDVYIPWDLEATPLQIETDSTLGSNEKTWVWLYNKDSGYIGTVAVTFSSPIQYYISYCTAKATDLPVQPPVEVDKIWTITKSETALIITCNDVEVLNYLFTDSSDKNCVPKYDGKNDVQQIKFSSDDTASDFFRPSGTISLVP
uniref:Putative secretory peptide-47 n=1 Tax=Pleurobrachia bachei TaxID=34499 RepID=M4H1E0_PLEBA|nr:putative secretory peptide-47 [Pleurobrachia bachei]|eukprot:sb/3472287/